MSVSQSILQNHVPNLLHLIGLGLIPIPLKVDLLLNPSHPEHMMATADSHLKTHPVQKSDQIRKANIRIGSAAQYLIQQFLVFAHVQNLPYTSNFRNAICSVMLRNGQIRGYRMTGKRAMTPIKGKV